MPSGVEFEFVERAPVLGHVHAAVAPVNEPIHAGFGAADVEVAQALAVGLLRIEQGLELLGREDEEHGLAQLVFDGEDVCAEPGGVGVARVDGVPSGHGFAGVGAEVAAGGDKHGVAPAVVSDDVATLASLVAERLAHLADLVGEGFDGAFEGAAGHGLRVFELADAGFELVEALFEDRDPLAVDVFHLLLLDFLDYISSISIESILDVSYIQVDCIK